MTQEEKQLLLIDLCARLPYGVKILDIPANVVGELFLVSTTDMVEYEPVDETDDDNWTQTLYNIKPYLRSMSSMTEEELREYKAFHCVIDEHTYFYLQMCTLVNELNMFDWLNKHHFDYRGLIKKGLALDCTGLNIY